MALPQPSGETVASEIGVADIGNGAPGGGSGTDTVVNIGSSEAKAGSEAETDSEVSEETEDQRKKLVKGVKKQLAEDQEKLRVRLRVYQRAEREATKAYYRKESKRQKREEERRKKRGDGQPGEAQPPIQQPAGKTFHPTDLSFKEITNLVFIENSPIHRKALEEWERKEKLFSARVERKSTKVGNLKNEVYQLIGFFSVFQGVVLTAVSQANLLHCNNRWSPIVLSVLASFVTIAAIAQKLIQISSFQKTISSEEASLKDVVHRAQELRRLGQDFKFAKFAKEKQIAPKKDFFWLYSGVVLGFLTVFTVVFPVSHWRILCNPGSGPCSTAPPSPP